MTTVSQAARHSGHFGNNASMPPGEAARLRRSHRWDVPRASRSVFIETKVEALGSRAPESTALSRYAEVAAILTGKSDASPEDGVHWIAALCRRLEIPSLRTYGVEEAHVPELIANAARASSMKGNPIILTETESRTILMHAL